MKHKSLSCQEVMIGKNTASFWNYNLKKSADEIVHSPIYINKNKLVLKHLCDIKGNILDVGLGYGYIEKLIVENKIKLKLFGIDISRFAVENAKITFRGKFLVSSVYKIPFSDEFFESVLALDVLEHLSQRRINLALKEINRVLKNNGLFIISIPINESLKDRIKNRHLRIYSEKVIRSELEENKFKIIHTYRLTAFRNLFEIKSLFNNIFKFKKPNLLILICRKHTI